MGTLSCASLSTRAHFQPGAPITERVRGEKDARDFLRRPSPRDTALRTDSVLTVGAGCSAAGRATASVHRCANDRGCVPRVSPPQARAAIPRVAAGLAGVLRV